MLSYSDIKKLAKARLKDAKVLLRGNRFEGAFYLCGYAVELALKARICKTLKWGGYPSTKNEFSNFTSFRTHNLEVLLRLSGIEIKVKSELMAEWSNVVAWDPESRYEPLGNVTQTHAELMVESTQKILKNL